MKNIFVGNLSFNTNEDELRQLFESYGQVDRVSIMTDRDTGRMTIDRSQVLWNVDCGTRLWFPIYAVLIDHRDGLFLFDTGVDPDHVRATFPWEQVEQRDVELVGDAGQPFDRQVGHPGEQFDERHGGIGPAVDRQLRTQLRHPPSGLGDELVVTAAVEPDGGGRHPVSSSGIT